MKKIRVYELAKKKNLTNKEVMELLSKKGYGKLSAITYVDSSVLDDSPSGSNKATVSHIFAGRTAAAPATHLKPLPGETA